MPNRTFYMSKDNDEWIKSQANKSGLVNDLIAAYRQNANAAPTNMLVNITPNTQIHVTNASHSFPNNQSFGLGSSIETHTLLDGNVDKDLPRGLSINS